MAMQKKTTEYPALEEEKTSGFFPGVVDGKGPGLAARQSGTVMMMMMRVSGCVVRYLRSGAICCHCQSCLDL